MKKIKILALLTALMLLLCGCGDKKPIPDVGSEDTDLATSGESSPAQVDFAQNDEEMFSNRDTDTNTQSDNNTTVTLKGNTASFQSDAVSLKDGNLTITDEGTYIIEGEFKGSITVNAGEDDKPRIVLNNAKIESEDRAAIYILEADKVFITLAEGSLNTLENGGNWPEGTNIDGVIFSKKDLTINGSGSLTVNSPTASGIVCKDDLVLAGGSYVINSASHGIDANDSVRIANAKVKIDAGKDGIHSENNEDASLGFVYISSGNFDIEAEGDGISAGSFAQFEGGSYNLLTGGGSVNAKKQTSDSFGGFMGGGRPGGPMFGGNSYSSATDDTDATSIKGIKAANSLLISEGEFTIDSADDAVHSNQSITVNGGSFNIKTGDDGFHADETLAVTAGNIDITESYEGLEALNVIVSGGNIKLTADDDGINAAGGTDSSGMGGMRPGGDRFGGGMGGSSSSKGSITISGGDLYIKASGDGIDANGSLSISGGKTVVTGPTNGDTATLDYDTSAVISGGTFIGTGASGMAQNFSSSENQGVVAIRTGNQSAATEIICKDNSGKVIISHKPELSFGVIILSSPDIKKGESYSLTVGSSAITVTAN